MMVEDRTEALRRIAELARAHNLTLAEIAQQLEPQHDTGPGRATRLLTRILGLIGATFMLAGIAAFVALQWDGMGSVARVVITLGAGAAVFTLGVMALQEESRRALALPLLLVAALLQPVGLMVAFAEFAGGGDGQVAALITSVTFAAQYLLTYARWRETVLLWVGVMFCTLAAGVGCDLLGLGEKVIIGMLGVGWLVCASGLRNSRHAAMTGHMFLLGCWAFLWATFESVERTPFEPLFLVCAVALVGVGVWAGSRMLNFAACLAILAYTAYFTGTYFADSVGWPVALMIIGILLLVLGWAALQVDRRYVRGGSAPPVR